MVILRRHPFHDELDLKEKFLLSGFCAAFAECFVMPVDLIKTRLQVQGEGGEPIRRGIFATFRDVIRQEGFFKIWFGLEASIPRQIVYSGTRVLTYEELRNHFLVRDADNSVSPWQAALCALAAGAVGQLVAVPLDLCKVNLMMEGRRVSDGLPPRFNNIFQCMAYLHDSGGVRGLWRGGSVSCQRAAVVTLGDLATYDVCKHTLMNKLCMQADSNTLHRLDVIRCVYGHFLMPPGRSQE